MGVGKRPTLSKRDQFDDMAMSSIRTLTQDGLAKLYRDTDALMKGADGEHKDYVRIVSALLELLGGQAVLPRHALKNAPGYQMVAGPCGGDITLQSVDPSAGRH
jgi:hypothetical protein